MHYWALWILCSLMTLSSLIMISRGLRGTTKELSYDASDVLIGCLVLFVCGQAVIELLR